MVFDCDGVLLDSVPVKTNAFGRLAEPYGEEARAKMVAYHESKGGVSRYKKFEWFFREVLKREITPEEKRRWADNFVAYSLDEVRKCPLIPGALETLRGWSERLPLYVCTGAPSDEVTEILKERDLISYFRGVFGSPPPKDESLAIIARDYARLPPDEILMVGDASTDLEAAARVGTLFYGVGPTLAGGDYPWSENLLPLNAWLEKRAASD